MKDADFLPGPRRKTFITPKLLSEELVTKISPRAKNLLRTVASSCLLPRRAASLFSPSPTELDALEDDVDALASSLPQTETQLSAEASEFDARFGIDRTDSPDGIATGLATGILAVTRLCIAPSSDPIEKASRAIEEMVLAAACLFAVQLVLDEPLPRPEVTDLTAEVDIDPLEPAERWGLGHHAFVTLTQALVMIHHRLPNATTQGDDAVARELISAAMLFHGSAVAMRLTGAMSAREYGRIRARMSPPFVSARFSGTWNADHRELLRTAHAVAKDMGEESPVVVRAREQYFLGLNSAYAMHRWVCDEVVGRAPSLAGSVNTHARSGSDSLRSFSRRALNAAGYMTKPKTVTRRTKK